MKAFTAWLFENKHLESGETENSDILYHAWRVKDWKPELWEKYINEAIDYLVEERTPVWADGIYRSALERAEETDRNRKAMENMRHIP